MPTFSITPNSGSKVVFNAPKSGPVVTIKGSNVIDATTGGGSVSVQVNKPLSTEMLKPDAPEVKSVDLNINKEVIEANVSGGIKFINVPPSSHMTIPELMGVKRLRALNAGDGESGRADANLIELTWENPKDMDDSLFPIATEDGYEGREYIIQSQMKASIYAFSVFMVVSDVYLPPVIQYPANGSGWYYMGDFLTNKALIRCPENKYVGFWVGMRSYDTQSKIKKNFYNYTQE